MPKETLTLLGVIMMPLEIILPLFLSRHTVGSTPMNIYLTSVPFRLLLGLAFVGVVYYAPVVKMETGGYPIYFYIILVTGLTLHQVCCLNFKLVSRQGQLEFILSKFYVEHVVRCVYAGVSDVYVCCQHVIFRKGQRPCYRRHVHDST
jgi:hypothetical protein